MFSRTNVGLLTERGLPPSPRTRPRTNCVLPAPSSPFRATHSPPRNVVASSAAMASVCSTLVEVRFTRESLYRVRTSGKEEGEPQRHRGHREKHGERQTDPLRLCLTQFSLCLCDSFRMLPCGLWSCFVFRADVHDAQHARAVVGPEELFAGWGRDRGGIGWTHDRPRR